MNTIRSPLRTRIIRSTYQLRSFTFTGLVGKEIGDELNQAHQNALKVSQLTREQVADVLVDLKRRIEGDFYIIEQGDEKIVFGNRECPFAEKVIGRPVPLLSD